MKARRKRSLSSESVRMSVRSSSRGTSITSPPSLAGEHPGGKPGEIIVRPLCRGDHIEPTRDNDPNPGDRFAGLSEHVARGDLAAPTVRFDARDLRGRQDWKRFIALGTAHRRICHGLNSWCSHRSRTTIRSEYSNTGSTR